MTQQCPCNSGQPYSACCAPIHANPKAATQAEQLMRARYSAHVLNKVAFIVETWHPSKRDQLSTEQIEQWCSSSDWLRLEINATQPGNPISYVTFTAVYKDKQGLHCHRECSRFSFEQAQWWYLDGEVSSTKPSRNDPCPCGSGKKYKKCCVS